MRDRSAYAGTTMLLGSFLAGVFLYALPSQNSPVNFKVTYADLVGPLQKYVRPPPTSLVPQTLTSRTGLLPSFFRVDRFQYSVHVALDGKDRVEGDIVRAAHGFGQSTRRSLSPRRGLLATGRQRGGRTVDRVGEGAF